MILISHRGNINGKLEFYENNPIYIDLALNQGYDVEIDVWYINKNIILGHDSPQYYIDFEWIKERIKKLWVHCKNIDAVFFFKNCDDEINYFWHEKDTISLTSKGYVWAYPGTQPIKNSISVLPEINNEDTSFCVGICSDLIENYKNEFKI